MIEEIFSTPVYTHVPKFQEIFLVQKEIEENLPVTREQDVFEKPDGWEEDCSTNIGFRFNTIRDYKLKNLENYIQRHVDEYIKQVNPFITADAECFLNHSWYAITGQGQSQEWHAHTDAVISGVYYYQTNGTDGDLWLRNPVPFSKIGLFPAGQIVPEKIVIKPSVGNIVLFPGWLEHKVCVNNTLDERIVVSFNYNLKTYEQEGTIYKKVGKDIYLTKDAKG